MTANKTTLAVLAATLCGGQQLIDPAHALAAPTSGATIPRTATIEVIRTAPGGAKRTMSFTMALAEQRRRPSRLKVSGDGTYYKIGISHDKHKGNTAVVHLDLRCDERGPVPVQIRRWRTSSKWRRAGRVQRRTRRRPTTSADVSLSSRVVLRQRTLLGRLQLQDGGELRITVTLK